MAGAKPLILVWLALLALLGLTVAASFQFAGPASIAISLGIAFIKATLIYWFFMDLRIENGIARLASAAGLIWLLIMFLLLTADYAARGWP